MLSRRSLVIVLLGLAVIFASVFGEPPSTHSGVNVEKTNEGLSTASDTLDKETGSRSIPNVETHDFQSEVRKLMKLIINSLYTNKEIFLRELLSNASDALDKMRILSLTDSEALSALPDLYIRVKSDKDSQTLEITDTGIGMSKEDLISNLGTIAKSGTSEFISQLSADQSSITPDLIGQFGVGFYSAFLVSDNVQVTSKKDGHEQYVWESNADNFSVYEDPQGDTLKRGTRIRLRLHKEASDYLQQETLENLIKKYSQFVSFPIHLWSSREETLEGETPQDTDANVEEEKKEGQKEKKTIWDWVHVNKQKPIWKRDAANITSDEYKSLYQALSADQAEPLGKTHFKAEGDVAFTSVLFIPQRSPGDVFSVNYNYKDRIKLYVHRVFISAAAEELIPKYLGFVIGLVDSDDLPLNVSREMLQQNQLVKVIRKKLVRKIIEMITNLSEEDFEKFWKQYSVHIKLGMIDDHSNRARLSKLLRYHTSTSGDKLVSLADYVSRMKENQKGIYYLTGRSVKENKASPLVERLLADGYEVIYMIDPLDEYVLQSFTEYEKKPLQNVAKEGLELEESESIKTQKEKQKKEFSHLLDWLKDNALKGKIEKAELSDRLNESPCALVATKYGWSGNMERIMRAQAHQKGDDLSSDYYANMNKIFEINPRHPIVKEMNERVKNDESDEGAKETAELLLYVATLRSGYMIPDSVDFAQKVERIMRKNLGVDQSEPVEPAPAESVEPKNIETKSDEDGDEVADTPKFSEETPESDEHTSTIGVSLVHTIG
ncbi:unnamed protein product [Dicrocoelium dendriticum]|nr:unnamed protein product [Dicrocoelium dendriticum]